MEAETCPQKQEQIPKWNRPEGRKGGEGKKDDLIAYKSEDLLEPIKAIADGQNCLVFVLRPQSHAVCWIRGALGGRAAMRWVEKGREREQASIKTLQITDLDLLYQHEHAV